MKREDDQTVGQAERPEERNAPASPPEPTEKRPAADGVPASNGAPSSTRQEAAGAPTDGQRQIRIGPGDDELASTRFTVPEVLSFLPLRDTVLFPAVIMPHTETRGPFVRLIDDAAVANDRIIGVVGIRSPGLAPSGERAEPSAGQIEIYTVGTVAAIRMMVKLPDGVRLILQGLGRVRILEVLQTEPYLKARVQPMPDVLPTDPEQQIEVQAMVRSVGSMFEKIVQMSPQLPDELQAIPLNVTDPGTLADVIASHLPTVPPAERQALLETVDVRERLRALTAILGRELNMLEIGSRIQSEVASEMSRMQREYYLREQMKAIQKELGETDERMAEVDELRRKIEDAGLPEEARKEAMRELDRLSKMPPAAAEYTVARTYLDWLTALPWNVSTEDNLDIAAVRQVLDEDHYGLEDVKERILEYLSVRKFKREGPVRHPILCFVGPPGVGKTSLGRSIARALGRKFVRMSLGGIRDEAEIRGHRRTYIGALPGQIIQGIRRAGSNNPVIMLDEVDKVGRDFRGDPTSALLEVLDPEQNRDFRDHYLDVPFDLSRVLFITTANVLDTVPPPLRDRMEVIEIAGYTEEEKFEIARRHLIPKQLEEHGLKTPEHLAWEDDALRTLIRGYTREAGVRNLEREIAAVTRKATRAFAEGREEPILVTPSLLQEYLGAPRYDFDEVLDRAARPGVATGLAYTPAGGDVLFVEVTAMPGRGGLTITGQLGEVMRESALAALAWVRSNSEALGIPRDYFRRHDFHLHVPAGAVPKDGPSAGITMAVALASLATGRRARSRVGMTGEITLTGRVLPVGGIKEKVLAARRAGIREVILPERNRRDWQEDVPDAVKTELKFHFVSSIDEVLPVALESEEAFKAAPEEPTPSRQAWWAAAQPEKG